MAVQTRIWVVPSTHVRLMMSTGRHRVIVVDGYLRIGIGHRAMLLRHGAKAVGAGGDSPEIERRSLLKHRVVPSFGLRVRSECERVLGILCY